MPRHIHTWIHLASGLLIAALLFAKTRPAAPEQPQPGQPPLTGQMAPPDERKADRGALETNAVPLIRPASSSTALEDILLEYRECDPLQIHAEKMAKIVAGDLRINLRLRGFSGEDEKRYLQVDNGLNNLCSELGVPLGFFIAREISLDPDFIRGALARFTGRERECVEKVVVLLDEKRRLDALFPDVVRANVFLDLGQDLTDYESDLLCDHLRPIYRLQDEWRKFGLKDPQMGERISAEYRDKLAEFIAKIDSFGEPGDNLDSWLKGKRKLKRSEIILDGFSLRLDGESHEVSRE